MSQQIQVLDARYVNGAALVKLLNDLFGEGNSTIDVYAPPLCPRFPSFANVSLMKHVDDVYTLTIPRELTKVQ